MSSNHRPVQACLVEIVCFVCRRTTVTAGHSRPCSQYHPCRSKNTRCTDTVPVGKSSTRYSCVTEVPAPQSLRGSSSLTRAGGGAVASTPTFPPRTAFTRPRTGFVAGRRDAFTAGFLPAAFPDAGCRRVAIAAFSPFGRRVAARFGRRRSAIYPSHEPRIQRARRRARHRREMVTSCAASGAAGVTSSRTLASTAPSRASTPGVLGSANVRYMNVGREHASVNAARGIFSSPQVLA